MVVYLEKQDFGFCRVCDSRPKNLSLQLLQQNLKIAPSQLKTGNLPGRFGIPVLLGNPRSEMHRWRTPESHFQKIPIGQ
jgi:hypothetical protein